MSSKGKRSKAVHNGNGQQETKRARPGVTFKISPKVKEAASFIRKNWSGESSLKDGSVFLTSDPFSVCSVKNFLSSPEAVDALESELGDLEFVEKSNDLYKFKQSASDLAEARAGHPAVEAFHALMRTEAKNWLSDATGLHLEEGSIDMFCARYDYTDYLLCHDDRLEGRLIAYIFYLVPESWRAEDGGALDLFDADQEGQPNKVHIIHINLPFIILLVCVCCRS